MSRTIRAFSSPRPTVVETLQQTFQDRPLLRAGPRLNRRMLGVLAKAQALYGLDIHGFVAMSNRWHLMATYQDPRQMARAHCFLSTNLSKEAGRLRDWAGPMFPERYRHVEIAPEPVTETARLKYLLSQGCREGLVASPLDWPGVSCVGSLLSGEPMTGEWIDRTALCRARERGEHVDAEDFTETLEVHLSPIPSLAHLDPEDYRRHMAALVRDIERETAARHRVDGTRPVGAEQVLAVDPHRRPQTVERRPRPWLHASDKEMRRPLRTALIYIVAAYRAAAHELGKGNRNAKFPVHTFPPGLPFVESPPKSMAPPRNIESLEPG